MKSYNFILIILFLYINTIKCTATTDCGITKLNGDKIDLSPLRLKHGYYTGSFFDNPPNSFNIFFNLCGGETHICSELSGSDGKELNNGCVFYPKSNSIISVGLSPSISEYSNNSMHGIKYSFQTSSSITDILLICKPDQVIANVKVCFLDRSKGYIYYQCILYTKYACETKSIPPDPTPNPTPDPTSDCSYNTPYKRYDLSPLTLHDFNTYYAAPFFDNAPNSFTILFNICGSNHISFYLKPFKGYLVCVFYGNTGYSYEGGSSIHEISEISDGLNFKYLQKDNATTNIKLLCDSNAHTLDIFKTNFTDSDNGRNYQIYAFTKYACALDGSSFTDNSNSRDINSSGSNNSNNSSGSNTDSSDSNNSFNDSSEGLDYICFNNCSQNGECTENGCVCSLNWSGFDCSENIAEKKNCINECSGNGYCLNDSCQCFGGWSGDDCSIGGEFKNPCSFKENGVDVTNMGSNITCTGFNDFICINEHLICDGRNSQSEVKCITFGKKLNCNGQNITCITGDTTCNYIQKVN